MHLLNDSLQINHKLFKLASFPTGNYQLRPTRPREAAPGGATRLSSSSGIMDRGGWGDQGWQLPATKSKVLGVAAQLEAQTLRLVFS